MTTNEFTYAHVSAMTAALLFERYARLDFSTLVPALLPALLLALIRRHISTEQAILEYLDDRNCKFSVEAVRYCLHLHHGQDPDRHLWLRAPDGNYFEPFGPTAQDEDRAAA